MVSKKILIAIFLNMFMLNYSEAYPVHVNWWLGFGENFSSNTASSGWTTGDLDFEKNKLSFHISSGVEVNGDKNPYTDVFNVTGSAWGNPYPQKILEMSELTIPVAWEGCGRGSLTNVITGKGYGRLEPSRMMTSGYHQPCIPKFELDYSVVLSSDVLNGTWDMFTYKHIVPLTLKNDNGRITYNKEVRINFNFQVPPRPQLVISPDKDTYFVNCVVNKYCRQDVILNVRNTTDYTPDIVARVNSSHSVYIDDKKVEPGEEAKIGEKFTVGMHSMEPGSNSIVVNIIATTP